MCIINASTSEGFDLLWFFTTLSMIVTQNQIMIVDTREHEMEEAIS